MGVDHVRLLFDVAEVLGLGSLVAQALFVTVQQYVVGSNAFMNLILSGDVDRLRHVAYIFDVLAFIKSARQF